MRSRKAVLYPKQLCARLRLSTLPALSLVSLTPPHKSETSVGEEKRSSEKLCNQDELQHDRVESIWALNSNRSRLKSSFSAI